MNSLSAGHNRTNAIEFSVFMGISPTARFGWQGSENDGHFYIQTPGGDAVQVEKGDVTVPGSVTAGAFIGDGAGLTGVAASAHAHRVADVSGLADSLAAIAPVNAPVSVTQLPASVQTLAAEVSDGDIDSGLINE